MRVRSRNGDAIATPRKDVRGRSASRNVARARDRDAAIGALGPAQAELRNRTALRRLHHPRGLGGDQRLEADDVEQSATGRPCAACTTRAVLVATSVWKPMMLSSAVSKSWQSSMGPVTRTIGSRANTNSPSGIASISTRGRKSARNRRNPDLNSKPPPGASSSER